MANEGDSARTSYYGVRVWIRYGLIYYVNSCGTHLLPSSAPNWAHIFQTIIIMSLPSRQLQPSIYPTLLCTCTDAGELLLFYYYYYYYVALAHTGAKSNCGTGGRSSGRSKPIIVVLRQLSGAPPGR